MVDPTPGTEATKVLHSSGTASPVDTAHPSTSSRCKLNAGERWRGYQIDGPVATGRINTFEATNIGQMEKVVITATLLTKFTASRRGVWDQLTTQLPPDTKILPCIEAHEEEGWRYEVTAQPSATNLREWIACHQAESWMQKHLLEQLAATVAALHSLGIVHLNIRPEVIFLNGEGHRMEIILGGLDTAVLYKQMGSTAVEVDPFYAPPEAVDTERPQPGIGLCAWDWWSVGRLIQEMILGRHVMSMLFGSDVIRDPTPLTRERATSLLRELEPPGLRAGAVEAMPELDPPMKVMLRGLLTSARDARWGLDAIRQWLAKENVSNHYDLARNARFFIWKGRGRTLSEAAQFFRTEERWMDGEQNAFDASNPETLANFLSTVPEHSADWRKLREIHAHVQSPEWNDIPEEARRSVGAALAWLTFGPQPGALLFKGRRIDVAGLTELLAGGQEAANFWVIKALMSAPCLALITPLDPAAGGILKQLAALGGEALRRAEGHRWVDANNPASLAYVLKVSLETGPVLRKRAERVRAAYATCNDAELAAILADKSPAMWAQVLLIVTSENPRQFGYVSRVEHARQNLAALQARRQQLEVASFWLRLNGLLLMGRPWSGSWRLFSFFWLGLVVFGVAIAQDVPTTTYVALGLLSLRYLLGSRVQRLIGRCDPAAAAWTWQDGPERCLTEAQRVWPEVSAETLPKLKQELVEAEAKMTVAPAGLDDRRAVTDQELRLTGLWPMFAAAALVGLVGSIQLLKDLGQTFGYDVLSIAANESGTKPGLGPQNRFAHHDTPEQIAAQLQKLHGLAPDMVEKVKRGEYEIVREAFGYTLRGPISKWNFVPPAVVPPLPVESRAPATPAQRAFALVSGELLLRSYGKKGVTAFFVIRVPNKNGFGLMVYNARERELVNNDALTLREGLPDKTWYRFERYNVIYLGAPSQMDVGPQSFLSENSEPAAMGDPAGRGGWPSAH